MKTINKKLFIIISVILFFAFIYFSYLVAKERFTQFDFNTTVKFQDHLPRRFDLIFSFFSVLGSAEVTGIIWLIIFVFVLIKRFFWAALSLFLLPLALAIELFGKVFVLHPAPPHLFYRGVLDTNLPLEFIQTEFSYPSGHETRTAFIIFFLTLFFFFRTSKKIQTVAYMVLFGILFIMTISRIYLGEHWTTDVVGGFLIGTSFGLLAGVFIPAKKKRIAENLGLSNP